MIESRYKIEYEFIEEDVKTISAMRVIWYLLLIPLVLFVVIAITYEFSFKEINRDATILIEKAKVHLLNLGEVKQLNKNIIQANIDEKKTPSSSLNKLTDSTKSVATKVIAVETNDNDDKNEEKINNLLATQKIQSQKIKEQISKNTQLSEKLNSVSAKLVIEQTKTESLNSKLSEQEKDKVELEEQLNKALTQSQSTNKIIKMVKLNELKPTLSDALIKPTDKLITTNKETVKPAVKLVNQEPTKEVDLTLVEESKKPEELEFNVGIPSETEIDKAYNNTIFTKIDRTGLLDLEETDSSPKSAIENSQTEDLAIVEKENEAKVQENIIASENTNTNAEKPEVNVIQTNKNEEKDTENTPISSPVDAIIAAMKASQANKIKSTDTVDDIDADLAKDIQQQLVEQGDLSIDN